MTDDELDPQGALAALRKLAAEQVAEREAVRERALAELRALAGRMNPHETIRSAYQQGPDGEALRRKRRNMPDGSLAHDSNAARAAYRKDRG